MTKINMRALVHIEGARPHLTRQEYRTLREQVLAGDNEGAMQGLRKILLMNGTNAVRGGAQ